MTINTFCLASPSDRKNNLNSDQARRNSTDSFLSAMYSEMKYKKVHPIPPNCVYIYVCGYVCWTHTYGEDFNGKYKQLGQKSIEPFVASFPHSPPPFFTHSQLSSPLSSFRPVGVLESVA